MKKNLLLVIILLTQLSYSQIAIETNANPDATSVLDLVSNSKGFLTPRMTSLQRDAIVSPVVGLLIYNTDDNDFNSYNGTTLGWQDFSTEFNSVESNTHITTTATTSTIASEMTVVPKIGTYSVLFNSQVKNALTYTTVATTVTSILGDLDSVIANLDNYFVDGTSQYNSITHVHYAAGVPALNEIPITNDMQANYTQAVMTLYPGAYFEGAAINFVTNAVITLNGLGNPNAKFIFKANAAINTGIGVTFILVNGAKANNIFWLANGAISIGATNEMKGNCISRAGAIAIGIATNLEGRILTSAGALTMGNGTLSVPNGTSFVDLKSLISFLGFTSAGSINITGSPSTFTYLNGDLFTCSEFNNFGFTPPFGTGTAQTQPIIGPPVTLVGKLYHCDGLMVTSGTGVESNVDSSGSFGIYKNGLEIVEASKTVQTNRNSSIITLQTIATVNGTDVIDVRWKTANGNTLLMGNRNLTLLKVQ